MPRWRGYRGDFTGVQDGVYLDREELGDVRKRDKASGLRVE